MRALSLEVMHAAGRDLHLCVCVGRHSTNFSHIVLVQTQVLRAAHKLDVAQLVDRIQSLLYQQVTVASTQAGTEQSHIEHAKQWVGLCTDMHLDNTADWCNYVLKQQQTASEETEKADNAVAAPVAVPVAPPAPPSRLAKIRKFLQKI